MRDLVAFDFTKTGQFKSTMTGQIVKKVDEVDRLIQKFAPAWKISQLPSVDKAILRLAIFELVFQKQQPYKVIIDEAVELGKEFGGTATAAFVNGVLGSLVKKELKISDEKR